MINELHVHGTKKQDGVIVGAFNDRIECSDNADWDQVLEEYQEKLELIPDEKWHLGLEPLSSRFEPTDVGRFARFQGKPVIVIDAPVDGVFAEVWFYQGSLAVKENVTPIEIESWDSRMEFDFVGSSFQAIDNFQPGPADVGSSVMFTGELKPCYGIIVEVKKSDISVWFPKGSHQVKGSFIGLFRADEIESLGPKFMETRLRSEAM